MTTNEVLADTSGVGEIRDPYLEQNAIGGNGYYDRGEISMDSPEEVMSSIDTPDFTFGGIKRTFATLQSELSERFDTGIEWFKDRRRTKQAAKTLGIVATASATAVVARKITSSS